MSEHHSPPSGVQVPIALQVDADGGNDDDNADADSSLGADAISSTASMTSSILDYRKENGRTYHRFRDGKYAYPNDDQENERLDLQHHLWALTLDGKLGLSPPNDPGAKPARVLDTGTGTGIWAIDYGDDHPESQIIGVDLSPTQPSFIPPNVEFQVDDVEDDWTYSKPFDYIHSRAMNGAVIDWATFFKRAYANLTPGGWFESQEFGLMACDDDTIDGTALATALEIIEKGSTILGRPFIKVWEMRRWMEEAGFVNISESHYHWASNTWPRDQKLKELGIWNNMNIGQGLEGFMIGVGTRALDWKPEEIKVLAAKAIDELNDRKIHAYWPINVLYGQKPE